MMIENNPIDSRIPPESEMGRQDALDAFLAVLNEVQPDHAYQENPYPVTRDEVDYGVTRTSFASCGPRTQHSPNKIGYKTRMTYINNICRERHLALLVHEATHVTIGPYSSDQGGSHPPNFWEEMAFNSTKVYSSLDSGDLSEIFPNADKELFLGEIESDPNSRTVDRRYWTVDECKNKIRDIVTYCTEYGYMPEDLPVKLKYRLNLDPRTAVRLHLLWEHTSNPEQIEEIVDKIVAGEIDPADVTVEISA